MPRARAPVPVFTQAHSQERYQRYDYAMKLPVTPWNRTTSLRLWYMSFEDKARGADLLLDDAVHVLSKFFPVDISAWIDHLSPDIRSSWEAVKSRLPKIYVEKIKRKEEHKSVVKPAKPDHLSGKSEEVEGWLYQVAKYLNQAQQLDDQDRISFAPQFVRGEALSWWLSTNKETELINTINDGESTYDESRFVQTWEQFQQAVRKHFKPVNTEEIALDQLTRLRQTTSVTEYIARFRKLAYEVPRMSQYDKLGHFMRGLKETVEYRSP